MMLPVSVIDELHQYATCIRCNKGQFRIDHKMKDARDSGQPAEWGPWTCNHCHKACVGVCHPDGSSMMARDDRKDADVPVWSFVHDGKALMILDDIAYNGEPDNKEYWFNEHTCPSNFFRDTEHIVDLENGSGDPHGICLYLGSIPKAALPLTSGHFDPLYNEQHTKLLLKMFDDQELEPPKWLTDALDHGSKPVRFT